MKEILMYKPIPDIDHKIITAIFVHGRYLAERRTRDSHGLTPIEEESRGVDEYRRNANRAVKVMLEYAEKYPDAVARLVV